MRLRSQVKFLSEMLKTHDIQSAAAICQCHTDSIYKAVRSGELHARKVGRRWVILEENLTEFLNRTTDAPRSTYAEKFTTPVLQPRKSQFIDLKALLKERLRKDSKPNLKAVSGVSNESLTGKEIHVKNAGKRAQRRKEYKERQERLPETEN